MYQVNVIGHESRGERAGEGRAKPTPEPAGDLAIGEGSATAGSANKVNPHV
jgi:hypothetical protein